MQEIEHRDRNGRPRLSQSNFRVPSSRSAYGSTPGWVEKATKDFLDDAGDTEPSFGIKQLPYTRPQLRETIKRRIMAGSNGGRPGQWSARKAQLVAQAYRRAGGGYRGKPGRTQRSLKKWTSERWTTSDGKPARRKGRMTRYLPAAAWKRLTPAQRRATIAKKLAGDKAGKQFVANTQRAATASKKTRSKTLGPSVDEVAKNPNAPKVFSDTSSEKDRIVSTEPLEQAFSPNKEKLNEITNAPSYGESPPVKPFVHGNIDIDNREPIEKQNGDFSLIEPTIIDGSGDELGMFVIVPLITKFGQLIEVANASSYFSKTDEHLGKFKSREDAEKYLEWLKDIEEEISYRDKKKPIISMHPIEEIAESAGDGFESRRMSIKNTIKRITDKYMTEKALGPTLRAVNSVQIYDPDAIDADGDGLVQDATPWMRPALPSSPIIAGLRSASKSSIASQRAVKEAQEFMKFISQHEPELTQIMKDLADKKGSSLYLRGLKNRQKTVESLALKAQRLQHLFDGDLTDSITSMNDPLRYTFESDDVNKYTNDVLEVISALAKKGHKAVVTNYWTSGDPYKGINVMVDHPDGFFYEIQFHTPSSYRLKNKLTPLYEKYRDEKNVKKRQEIYDEMLKLSKGVSIPKEIGKFGEPLSRGSGQADFKPARPGKLIPTPLGLSSRRAGASPKKFKPVKPVPLSKISTDLSDEFPIVTNAYQFATAQPTKNRLRRILDIIARRDDSSRKDALQITRNILRDAFQEDLERLKNGELTERKVRPSLERSKNELFDSLQIVFDTRPGGAQNLPTMRGKPYPPFDSIISRDIDWRSIFIPNDQDRKDMFGEISKFIFDDTSEKMTGDENELWAKEYKKYLDSLNPEDRVLFTKDEEERMMENPSFNNNDDATFIGIYAYGMRDPGSYLSSKEVHDGMHLAAGRGFDRHGEWAATLAEISFILNIPGVPDEIKNRKASEFYVRTIDAHFDIDEIFEIMPNFSTSPTTVLDMQKVLDISVEKSTYKGVGGMSSKRAIPLRDATTSDINQIADEYLKSERFLRRTDKTYGNESQIGMRSIRERIPMKEVLQSTQELDDENNDSKYMQNQVWKNLNEELEKRLLTMNGWTDDQKERIKKQVDNLLSNLRAMRDDWQSMGRRERSGILRRERLIDGFESHPEIDMNIDDIIKQAELRIHDDGTLSFKLPPNPILRELIPGDRNYQDVEIPDRETIRSIVDNIKTNANTSQWSKLFESIYQRVGGSAQLAVFPTNGEELPHHSLYLPSYKRSLNTKFPGLSDAINYRYNDIAARILQHYIGPELAKVKRNENPKIGKVVNDNDYYIHGYLGLMADPHAWREIGQELDKRFEVPPSVILHDVLGHYANGNTFDRHGEWGNILATIALARDKEFWEKLRQIPELADLTDEDREIFIRGLLADVAAAWIHRVGYPESPVYTPGYIKERINYYDGPIDELLDQLDPPSTQSQGGMSSTRRTPLTNVTDRQLVNLGLQSVDGAAIRGMVLKPSGMSSFRDDTMARNIDFIREETARQQKLLATTIDEQFKEKWGPLFDILDMSLGLSESELRLQFVRNKEDYLLGKAGLLDLNNLMKSVRMMPKNNPLNFDSEELEQLISAIQKFAPRTPKKEFVLRQARETLRLRKFYEKSEYRKSANRRPMNRDFISPQEFARVPYRGAWIYPDGTIYPVFWHNDEHSLSDSFEDGILRLDVARVTRRDANVHLNLEAKLEKLTPSQIETVIELYENFGQPKLFWDVQSNFVSFDEDGEIRKQGEAARRKILRNSLNDGLGNKSNGVKLVEIQPDGDELNSVGGMSSRRRDMTDSEKERLIPITLAPDEKIKLQPGTTLVYTDEDDRITRIELIGPQVARVRGIPGIKLYTDPNPDNQDAVDARMRQWEIDFGPISSDQRQARGRGSQPDRTAREQGRPRTTNEDPIDRILRETEEARGRRGLSSRTDTAVPVALSKNGDSLKIKYGDFELDIRDPEATDNKWAKAYEKLLSWEGSYYSRMISSALLGLEPPMAHGGKGPKAKFAEAASTGSSKGLGNFDIIDFRAAIYNAFVSIERVRNSSPTVRPLYRGMVVDNDSSIVDSNVGDTFSMPLTSFTYVELGAKEFAGGSFNSPESSEGTPILIVLEKGAKAADCPNGTDMFRDGYLDSIDDGDGGLVRVPMESVTQGKFKIVGKEKTMLPAGEGWEIRIQQLDTYVPAFGMSSRTNPPVPGWAKEADISRPINGARSTTLEKLSDEEILALATREGISEENLKDLYKTIVGARDFIRRSKNEPLSHAPGLSEETARRMRDSIRVETAPNGVPMIIAEPFQAVIDEVPDKRDWGRVVAPSPEDIQRLADAIREAQDSDLPILEGLSEESRDRINDAAYKVGFDDFDSPFNKIKARILAKLGSSEDEWVEISGGGGDVWVDTYLKSLADPESMQATPGSDGIHDFFGHFGVGRGFDRHGEWAAALVTDSLIRDHPAFDFLSPNEREGLRRKFFAEGAGGVARLSQQLDTEYERRFGIPRYFATRLHDPISKTVTEIVDTRTSEQKRVAKEFLRLDRFIGDEFRVPKKEARKKGFLRKKPAEGYRAPRLSMDAILDALGVPPATTRPEARSGARGMASTRSSRNSIPFTEASNELLLSIAGNEAVIKKERSIRNISGMSSRTDTYAILDGRDFEEILDELELNETEKDIARQALLQIYENENNSTFATRQKAIDEIKNLLSDNPTTPIDEKTKKAIESISIKMSSNGIPVIFAQPHPTISSILPNRDWSEIEAPSAEYLKSILPKLKYKIKSPKNTSYKNQFRIGRNAPISIETNELHRKFDDQFRDIIKKIQGHDSEDNYKEYKSLDGSWVQQYVSLVMNPARGSAIPDVEHDILGHFGTGRGFDRHGEWANALAITSFILDSNLFDLTEEERDAMAFWWLGQYGIPQIFKQLNQESGSEEGFDVGELLAKISHGEFDHAFDGSTRELIALLDAENTSREGVRSASTRSVKLTEASPELLLRAEKEASKDRSEFVLKSTLENLSSRPDKNEIISGMSSRNRLTDEQEQQMLEMLTDGMGNSEIMKKLGVTMGVVRQFRIKNNIPPTGNNRLTDEQIQQIFEMLAYGMSDIQIAEKLGVTRGAIRNHRINNNIPSNLKAGQAATGKWGKAGIPASVVARNKKIIALHKLGKLDTEIARELGIGKTTVREIRVEAGLTRNTYRKWNTPGELGQGRSKNK